MICEAAQTQVTESASVLRYNAPIYSRKSKWKPDTHGAAFLEALEVNMSVFFRAITYATLFIAIVLVYIPASILSWSGIDRPMTIEIQQVAGIAMETMGALIALWCIFTFAAVGKGTPAPFDPPRRLVKRGPYRFVRNPMYIGAGFAMAGAASFYESLPLLAYTGGFLLIVHLFVISYEEPALRRTFGQEYEKYCRQVKRWWPRPISSK